MMTSKQRAYLRGLGVKIEPVVQVGKYGLTPEIVQSVDEALEARELVKVNVLESCMEDLKFISSAISERTKSEIVRVMGRKIVFYRKSSKKSIIELPE